MRRPVRFFVYEIPEDGTLWLDDDDGETSVVMSVESHAAGANLRVIVMQQGGAQSGTPTGGNL
jgi:hypothetical protein